MKTKSIIEDILSRLPRYAEPDISDNIRGRLSEHNIITIILDDDPTGSQTVHGVPVICEISYDAILEEILSGSKAFFILTNTRALTPDKARELSSQLGMILRKILSKYGKKVFIISRGDSTLRSHFPIELSAISESLDYKSPKWIIAPAFFEGGRYTMDNEQWVLENNTLIAAAKTEFARDTDFNYESSNLITWASDKFNNIIQESDIEAYSLLDLRLGAYANKKTITFTKTYTILNALEYRDLQEVASMILNQINEYDFLVHSSASFVKAFLGIEDKPLLDRNTLGIPSSNIGLIIVGSHVNKTTEQLQYLIDNTDAKHFILDGNLLFLEDKAYISEIVDEIKLCFLQKRHVIISTERKIISIPGQDYVDIGKKISSSLCTIAAEVKMHPDFIISKGGITSHNLATKGLAVKRAMVEGQIIPGVPVWKILSSSDTLIPFVIFPGNVGEPEALLNTFKILSYE